MRTHRHERRRKNEPGAWTRGSFFAPERKTKSSVSAPVRSDRELSQTSSSSHDTDRSPSSSSMTSHSCWSTGLIVLHTVPPPGCSQQYTSTPSSSLSDHPTRHGSMLASGSISTTSSSGELLLIRTTPRIIW